MSDKILLLLALPVVWAATVASQSTELPQKEPAAPATEAPHAAAPSGPLSKYQGQIVREIDFRGVTGASPEMLRSLVVQKQNEPLDPGKLRDSLAALYATGRFATLDVEADARPSGGVAITFVATENYFNGDVDVTGTPNKGNPKVQQLVAATRLDLGAVFSLDKVEQSIDRMKKVLADNGYYQATISYQLSPHEQTRQMGVVFQVSPGAPARVGEVNIEGDTGIAPDRVRAITKLKEGSKVQQGHLTRALERLRAHYQKNDHLEAQVSLTQREYRPETNRLDYFFQVEEGPTVAILTEGETIRKGTLKKLVPVYQENSLDDDLLNEGRRNLRDYLQTKGYFAANVEVQRRQDNAPNHLDVVYKIAPGPRQKLAAVILQGNKYFSADDIRERMAIQPSSLLLENGRYSQAMLNSDVDAIKNLYVSNGFLDVKVQPDLQDNYRGEKDQIAVLINIDEGTQSLVKELKLVGNQHITTDKLLTRVTELEGQPFSEANLAADRDAVTYYYYNHGFPDMQFDVAASPVEGEPHRLQVVYTISEGRQVFVQDVLVSGLEHTRPYVVDRQMRIQDNSPLSQNRMVETQRRLYDLGLFNEVDMAVQNPEGVEPSKNVLFNLQEAKRWTFRYGGGIEFATGNIPSTKNPQGKTGVSPNGVLEITRLNMFGRDQTLSMRGQLGLLTRRALATYEAPRLFHRESWRLSLSTLYDNTADVNTFTSQRLEGSVQAEQRYSRAISLLYRMSYQRVAVDPNSLVIDPTLIPLYSKPVLLAIPSFTFVRDTRDSPIDTRKGSYTLGDFGLATSALGSQANFGKVILQNATYYRFKKRWVIARNTQIGIEHPYGNNNFLSLPPSTLLPAEATSIPLPELFFSGGGNSLRSFSINQAGPRDPVTGFPIGGQGLFVNNLELRTPPILLPYVGDNLGLVFFHDMGNVFDSSNHILSGMLRLHQPSIADCSSPGSNTLCNFSYNPQAVGMGVRYKTPVGPVRFDIGYNFNPTRYPIQEKDQVETLRHVNFFFSIGQTF